MFGRLAAVIQEFSVDATGFFEGVGEDGQILKATAGLAGARIEAMG